MCVCVCVCERVCVCVPFLVLRDDPILASLIGEKLPCRLCRTGEGERGREGEGK